ncbi:MAG TPA: hypothetical protein VFE30_10295 [Anaeromyxobacteraceae bacterium]|jgi:hypothetical protein|nr:hypothetical protein [Anaeromyxobacteraceae bacterium]
MERPAPTVVARITPRRRAVMTLDPTPEPVQLPPSVSRGSAAEGPREEGSHTLLAAALALAGVALVGWRIFQLLRP